MQMICPDFWIALIKHLGLSLGKVFRQTLQLTQIRIYLYTIISHKYISRNIPCPRQSQQSCQNLGLSMQTRFALIISRYAYAVWQLKCHKTNWLPWQKTQSDKHTHTHNQTRQRENEECIVDVHVDGNQANGPWQQQGYGNGVTLKCLLN